MELTLSCSFAFPFSSSIKIRKESKSPVLAASQTCRRIHLHHQNAWPLVREKFLQDKTCWLASKPVANIWPKDLLGTIGMMRCEWVVLHKGDEFDQLRYPLLSTLTNQYQGGTRCGCSHDRLSGGHHFPHDDLRHHLPSLTEVGADIPGIVQSRFPNHCRASSSTIPRSASTYKPTTSREAKQVSMSQLPVINLFCTTVCPETGKAASIREYKYGKYRDISDRAGMSFYPLVHEVYGRVGEQARRLFVACVAKIARLRRQSVIHY